MQHPVREPVAQIHLAAQNPANGDQHLFGCFLFHDVAVGAGTQRALRVGQFVMHGKNQHRQTGIAHADCLQKLQAVRPM